MQTDAILPSVQPCHGQTRRSMWGGGVVWWCLVNFKCRGVLLIWIKLGQGPAALGVGNCGVVWICFLSFIFSLFYIRPPPLPLWETI